MTGMHSSYILPANGATTICYSIDIIDYVNVVYNIYGYSNDIFKGFINCTVIDLASEYINYS